MRLLRFVRALRLAWDMSKNISAEHIECDRIPLGPHDVILLQYEGLMSQDAADRIKELFNRIWPRRDVLVIQNNMKVRAMERSEAEAVAAKLLRA